MKGNEMIDTKKFREIKDTFFSWRAPTKKEVQLNAEVVFEIM